MKKIIIYMLIFSIMFTSIGFNFSKVYSQSLLIESNNLDPSITEKNYVTQLENISNQLDILSSNVLSTITNIKDKKELIKDASYIKSQIRRLRLDLSEYHKTESGDIEKNPISLAFLNALNFYSMSLSYLLGAIESTDASDESKYLQHYYTNKSSGDSMLLWVKEELSK